MKNILFLVIFALLSLSLLNAQYYYIPYTSPGGNPGGLNTDNEQPANSGLPASWTVILQSAQPTGTYTANQSLPFAFDFNGSPVTQYKVSNVGVLTFDVGSTVNPVISNTALPSAGVPNSSVCVWGLSAPGSNDFMVKKTFGSAPNRQHWIMFASYDFNGSWSYWSIALEETTNKIYVVDQRHQNTQAGLTIGVQVDATTAYQVTGSPNVASLAGNDSAPLDNAYYEFSFGVQPDYDFQVDELDLALYPNLSSAPFDITGSLFNAGTQTITSFDVSYTVNGGAVQMGSISSVSIAPGDQYQFAHPTQWTPTASGNYTVEAWTSNLNGNPDANPGNDTASADVMISEAVPNIIDTYLSSVPLFETVGTSSQALNNPMDLDFHPDLARKELWVINLDNENSGGSTVTFSNAGESNQSDLWRRDGNAWHFMSLPSGIAFGENGDFATSPSVFDANHDGGTPFTGPSLWSSDPAIYAQPSGGNGSHLDMLHASPYSMGIAHEVGNAYWIFDANTNDIVRYDFVEDHGPGNDDHSDGIIRRVQNIFVDDIAQGIACHLDLEKSSGMLYIVDAGAKRILKMDINSGSIFGTPGFGPFEPLAEYSNINNVTWDVIAEDDFVEPAGIAVIEDRMLVGDHANGDIIIYDISGATAMEMGRIETGSPGVMGITIGPEGYIWYVNAITDQVVKIGQGAVSIDPELTSAQVRMYPNPVVDRVMLKWENLYLANAQIEVFDLMGHQVGSQTIYNSAEAEINVSNLPAGMYSITIHKAGKTLYTDRFSKIK